MPEIYVSTDIEADGRIPGVFSMLSFGSAAYQADGTLLGTFTANLEQLPEASTDPDTMAWWAERPQEWAACRQDLQKPEAAMKAYYAWLMDLPGTPVRLLASERHAGRGVTIAFLDSGFFAHPDLVRPADRILHYHDVTRPRASRAPRSELLRADESSWHGMMTSVVAAGNGHLSNGFYRGLAHSFGNDRGVYRFVEKSQQAGCRCYLDNAASFIHECAVQRGSQDNP